MTGPLNLLGMSIAEETEDECDADSSASAKSGLVVLFIYIFIDGVLVILCNWTHAIVLNATHGHFRVFGSVEDEKLTLFDPVGEENIHTADRS